MPRKALVLGGGGPVGIAWESGMLAGLAEAGLDLSGADFILGTSAGSVVGSQLAMGRSPGDLAAPFLDERTSQQPASPSQLLGSSPPDLSVLIQKMAKAVASTGPAEPARAELGAWALQAQTMSEDAFIATFGHAIRDHPEASWPDRFACTAVDTLDGTFVVWNKDSGVSLGRAVASSCSVPGIFPPVTLRGRRYMDGGMRSATNADLAKGHDIVFVLALTVAAAAASPIGDIFRRRLEEELDTVRSSGGRVALILPDAASQEAFGLNLMDYRRRPAAARAGMIQGRAQAANLQPLWEA
ncbi:MAG TPA: patatin-like phospholipase family protein [Bryobacteraceae bacterium]|nr:patatin-like phospholipase family protein [Bryobacteraceae bacterium]